MWNSRAYDMAREASRIATEARDDNKATLAELKNHVTDCGGKYVDMDRKMDERAKTLKSDLTDWRTLMSGRMDSQDKQLQKIKDGNTKIFGAFVMVLLGVIGFLLEHSGVFDHLTIK